MEQSTVREYVKDFSELMLQISDLTMVETESFVELGPKKDKFETHKPKETDNDGVEYEDDGQVKNGNSGNGKNGGNRKPYNVKDDEPNKAMMRLGLIVRSIEGKRVREVNVMHFVLWSA
ncbi:hypothetical protein Gohar_001299 [Gossypium harknessii]|uniref:Uncharacterized protein n=1 Tax=Gossypium harknessii TaxID=34285 RepID=A0A7J9I3F7_9ROSI|nr:hypothetical protein [Gossypium harknessii]